MTHHQFGSIAGDSDTGGTFNLGDSVYLEHHATVAVAKEDTPVDAGLIALEVSGKVVGTADTLQTVWVMGAMDAGMLAATLAAAVDRMTDEERTDFRVGWVEGLKQ